jgi:Icc-related predicted phosphoesterase
VIRVAAVGDVHFGDDSAGTMRPHLDTLPEHADVLLIAGDLTRHGLPEEAAVLADELRGAPVPVVAILGNHDYHCDAQDEIRSLLEEAGVTVLEGESAVLEIGGCTLGVVGSKGFGGGFAGACGSDFGEPEMKAFIRHTKEISDRIFEQLSGLDTDFRVVLLHYSPVEDTLVGERLEIYPFLGSYLLAEAIDSAGADLAIHGHAHGGSEKGLTAKGIEVRNVAQPMIERAYTVYCLGSSSEPQK